MLGGGYNIIVGQVKVIDILEEFRYFCKGGV